ncbi:MAG TPA: glycosyltransferase family 39 protein [Saprospiraceae bacterium]|nr:glycosyltransferase family 39 protein [Saprospiraceae bacterium]HMQ85835.1 glycosyltransferase family 39 protein [Saprospiraceae bacterium]
MIPPASNGRPIVLWFVLLALALRVFTFLPAVIDHDESTYLVIADSLLKGHTYFVDYIDTKPIGIFLLYAGLMSLFGKSIVILRLVVALLVALTAYLLYRAKFAHDGHHQSALWVGGLYIFITSTFTFFGVSPNTELFFNVFTALSLWLILAHPTIWAYGLAGLSLGCGFVIKYVVAFDALAFGLFLLWLAYLKKRNWWTTLIGCSLMVIGFAIPFGLVWWYYWSQGLEEPFLFYSFQVSSRYPNTRTLEVYTVFVLDFLVHFLPVTLLFFYSLFSKKIPTLTRQLSGLWGLLTMLIVLLPGKRFGHYFIQFMLPYCWLAGSFFMIQPSPLPAWLQKALSPPWSFRLLAFITALISFLQLADYLGKPDHPRNIANYLRDRLEVEDRIYMANDQIVYHLLDRASPIPYVHPSLFWEPKHIAALEIDVAQELEKIYAAQPRYVVLRKKPKDERLSPWLQEFYTRDTLIDDKSVIYRRKVKGSF